MDVRQVSLSTACQGNTPLYAHRAGVAPSLRLPLLLRGPASPESAATRPGVAAMTRPRGFALVGTHPPGASWHEGNHRQGRILA